MIKWKTSFVNELVVFQFVILCCHCQHYTNYYAVNIDGGPDVAQQLAAKHGFLYIDQIMPGYYSLKHPRVAKRSVLPDLHNHKQLFQEANVKWIEQQVAKRRVKRDIEFNDPQWPKEWYLHRGRGFDMNVLAAYKWQMSGRGIVVSILDDGIEKDHPDLVKNYDPDASYDVNGHDNDPQPRYDFTNENRHGTRCAGEVAAEANNNICNVGVAYNARIGGVRMLDGEVTDAVEAQSLALNQQHIDIYSASWGPDDDGRTVDGPGPLARDAFANGILLGRRGLGSIFVWASGNGGILSDNCNCDGYTNSIYTLSISSASENGNVPWYSEACSSTLATTYSSGNLGERQISTTDLHQKCTDTHTGTSASAPLAAGVCALALEANPLLTWRDMQHIVVLTAQPANLQADDWVVNGAGRNVSHHFGFGLMDAGAMVEVAMEWKPVPRQQRCEVLSYISERTVPVDGFIEATLTTDACRGDVRHLEHVEAVVTLSASVRGQISIYLTSPAGTRSNLLLQRSIDRSGDGFNAWPFMTTHSWGESPLGVWRLEVRNGASVATLKNWTLVLYGTKEDPQPPNMGKRHLLEPDAGVCGESEYLLATYCYTVCPRLFYAANVTIEQFETNGTTLYNVTVPKCLRCDSSCMHCDGPANNQCTSCLAFYMLTSDGRCVDPSASAPVSWLRDRKAPLIISIVALGFVVLLAPFVVWLAVDRWRKANGVTYRPVDEESDEVDDENMLPFLLNEEKI